jgi:hypothetical protein
MSINRNIIFLGLISTFFSSVFSLNLVSGRMSEEKCNATLAIQKTPDFCALAGNVDQMLASITDPSSKAIIQQAMNRLDSALKNETQAAMISIIALNQEMIEQFKQQEPDSYNKLMSLFNSAQQQASNDGVPSTSDICSFSKQFQAIRNNLSDTGKQTLGTILCGIHQTLKTQMPKLFGQVISKQDFMNLIMKNPQLMQQLGGHFQKFFSNSMN